MSLQPHWTLKAPTDHYPRGVHSSSVIFCFIQEAAWLSSLLPELNERGVALYGIVHEERGANSFKDYLKGELLFDEEVC